MTFNSFRTGPNFFSYNHWIKLTLFLQVKTEEREINPDTVHVLMTFF